jgi:hypothetical protein
MGSSGGPRLKRAWVARPGQWTMPPGLVWPLGLILLTSSPPLGASRGKILMPEKSQVNLSLGRSLKRQNTQNGVFCSTEF